MTKYSLSPLMLMCMAAFILIDGSFLSVASVLAAIFHETAHIAALHLTGGRVRGIFAKGRGIALKTGLMSYRQEFLVALAGPLCSFALCLLCSVLFGIYRSKALLLFAFSNGALFCINALPVYPLDCGRALCCLMLMRFDRKKAYFIIKLISFIFLLPTGIVSVIIFIRSGYNLSLLIICIYLAVLQAGVMNL